MYVWETSSFYLLEVPAASFFHSHEQSRLGVTELQDVQANIPLVSDCFACTHACGHYLGVTSTCGPSPLPVPSFDARSRNADVSPEPAADAQWTSRRPEAFLAASRLTPELTGTNDP